MNPDIPLDPTDDQASVGTIPYQNPLTRPKVSLSTRPHILISVMFSQILSIWKCWVSIEETTSNSNTLTKNTPKKSLYSGKKLRVLDTVIPIKTTFVCCQWCVPDHEQTTYKVFHKRGIGSGRCRLSALRTYIWKFRNGWQTLSLRFWILFKCQNQGPVTVIFCSHLYLSFHKLISQ